MSLVPVGSADSEWQVILRNQETQAAVLYDPYTHRFALASELHRLGPSTSPVNKPTQRRCSHCGSIVSDEQQRQQNSYYEYGRSHAGSASGSQMVGTPPNGPFRAITSPRPSLDNHGHSHSLSGVDAHDAILHDTDGGSMRDPNYFQLLEYFNFNGPALPSTARIETESLASAPGSPRLKHALDGSENPSESSSFTSPVPAISNIPNDYTGGISESAFSQGYFDRFFVSETLLGRGSRGAVYKVEHVLDGVSLGTFALKKVAVGNNHEWLEKVLSEVNLLRMLSHRNLVRYNHVWLETSSLSSFGPLVPCAYILQEFCDGGTLEEYMESHSHHRQELFGTVPDSSTASDSRPQSRGEPTTTKRQSESARLKREKTRQRMNLAEQPKLETDDDIVKLTVEEIVSFMHDITSGVAYLHDNQIVHRDLKPSNCLLLKLQSSTPTNPSAQNANQATGIIKNKRFPRVLVSDFGEGQVEGRRRTGTGSTGTLEYCSPELLARPGINTNGSGEEELGQFSKKTDIFSLGMILHYLCFSRLPYSNVWQEKGDLEALTEEVRLFPGFDEALSNSKFHRTDLGPLVDLIACMLSLNPQNRPDAHQVLFVLEEFAETINRQNSPRGNSTVSAAVVKEVKLLMGPKSYTGRLWTLKPPLRWIRSEKRKVAKIAMIVLKAASLYSFTLNNDNDKALTYMLFLMFGYELSLQSFKWSTALFAMHFAIILAA